MISSQCFQTLVKYCLLLSFLSSRNSDSSYNFGIDQGEAVTSCKDVEFMCTSIQMCISKDWVCDGDMDCSDGTDEDPSNCPGGIGSSQVTPQVTCTDDEFLCTSTHHCINKDWVCDGDPDCSDGADEAHCSVPSSTTSTQQPPSNCEENDFTCYILHQCISKDWVCDGDKDCTDGTDEDSSKCRNSNCTDTQFACTTSGECIDKSWLCDGDEDCTDSTDENPANCVTSNQQSQVGPSSPPTHARSQPRIGKCESGFVQCTISSNRCIKSEWICDLDLDCPGGEDELDCPVGLFLGDWKGQLF